MKTIPSILLALFAVAGCAKNDSAPTPTRTLTLAKGAEVPLILLRQIEAGSSREGLLVPFMVADDVKGEDGSVLIPKGSVAEGEVTWSRSEGSLGSVMNQPARLAVRFKHTRAAGNETVELCAEVDKPDEAYQFTRENTGKPWEKEEFDRMEPALNEAVAKALGEFMESGDAGSLNADTQAREWLIATSREPGMEAARAFLDPDAPEKAQVSEMERVVRHLRDGSITSLAGGEVMLAISALQQFGKLAQSVERSVSSKLKGRTIKAYIGTPATAFVAKDVLVKVGT